MIGGMYETFDHTADLGLRVRAADRDALFADAALGLTSMLVEDVASVRDEVAVEVTLPADDVELLLFDWLKALLSRFDADKLLFRRFEARVTEAGLRATAWGERMDESRHEMAHEVKSITYHGLKVVRDGGGWLAEVIVDI